MADNQNGARLGPGARHATNASTASDATADSSQSGQRRSFIGSIRSRFGRRSDDSRSPLTNPSPATRRPEAPPPYSAIDQSPVASPVSPNGPAFAAPRSIATATAAPAQAPPAIPAAAPAALPAAVPVAATPAAPIVTPPSGLGSFRAASPAPSNRSTNSRLTVDGIRTNEDPYAFLATFDTVFVIDDSGSMAGSPWKEVWAVLTGIVPICTKRDADGVDIYFLNHRSTAEQQEALLGRAHQQGQPRVPPGKSTGGFHNVRSNEAIGNIFRAVRPGKSTPTGMRLNNILKPYLRFYESKWKELQDRGEFGDPDPEEVKPMNIIVITDGVPTDDLEDVLIKAAKKLDSMDAPPYQIGIQFFQVGTEPEAAAYLKHLDDTLGQNEAEPIRDMVDTVTWNQPAQGLTLSADTILKTVLGAVVKRLDNKIPTRGGRGGPSRSQHANNNTLRP